MPNWDYFVLDLDPEQSPADRQKPLQELGSKGWELVSVTSYQSMETGAILLAYFKRPAE